MNKKITIELSDAILLRAEARAKEAGYDSLAAYVDALMRDDLEFTLDQDWVLERLEEGIASGNSGPITKEKIHLLVAEGAKRTIAKP